MSTPLLSIGIIFKNDIRCLERCLKSLRPLREAVPCELVMADTGSDDGSRAVAEQYADLVIDFPWVNDFAAARNAVLDRCTGAWHLTVDTDEWLDEDVSELTAFLLNRNGQEEIVGAVVQRNYTTYDFKGPYLDFFASRLACMAGHPRYIGTIHEHWKWPDARGRRHIILRQTVLHHDGYVEQNETEAAGRGKRERNMALLREKAEREPDNLMVRLQMVESGSDAPDFPDILRQAVAMVEAKKPYWEMVGPPILRYAVAVALMKKLPEGGEWIQKAEEWFPDSAFTRIDVAFFAFSHFLARDELEQAALRGERYLRAMEEDRAGRLDPAARLRSSIQAATPLKEQALKISLADVYRNLNREEDARELLLHMDFTALDPGTAGKLAQALMNLQLNTGTDTAPPVRAAWEGISLPLPDQSKAEARKTAFCQTMLPAFRRENREREARQNGFSRHTYTVMLPLAGQCELGTAAAMLETEDLPLLERLLSTVEDWTMLPPEALDHALRCGVPFPPADRPLTIEVMDLLAARLAGCGDCLELIQNRPLPEDVRELCWHRGLVFAAVRACKWEDAEQGMWLLRRFVEVERAFLPLCYARQAREEALFLLPPMHRFGVFCVRAFDALQAGDGAGCVRLLRKGVSACEDMKPAVEFLLQNTPRLRPSRPSDELLSLAERVRTLLAACAPDDPAVEAIRQSPAYRKVAHLIEGIPAPIPGGLPQ